MKPSVAAHAFDPSTSEARAVGSLSSRSGWFTQQIPGQPRVQRDARLKKQNKKNLLHLRSPEIKIEGQSETKDCKDYLFIYLLLYYLSYLR